MKPELIIDTRAQLAEGPVWDESENLLYFVDITGGELHIFDPQSGEHRRINAGEDIGCVAPRKGGGVIAALRSGFKFIDTMSGRIEAIFDPEADKPRNRFNDGKCDPAGRFWAGSCIETGVAPTGTLYRLDADLSVHATLTDLSVSNGIAWSKDNKTMYFIDSPTKIIRAFDYDLETGHIGDARIAVAVPEGIGIPDGMTIDSEGTLWVAHWGGSRICRWDPQTGEKIDEIMFPDENVSSCVFGGPELRSLYVTTARQGLDEKRLATQPNAGGLYRVVPGVVGTPTVSFEG